MQARRPQADRENSYLAVSVTRTPSLRVYWYVNRGKRGRQQAWQARTVLPKSNRSHAYRMETLLKHSPGWLQPIVVTAEEYFAGLRREWAKSALLRRKAIRLARDIETNRREIGEANAEMEEEMARAIDEALGIPQEVRSKREKTETFELEQGEINPDHSLLAER